MNLEQLITKSGDSQLISYHFSNSLLSITLDFDELDSLVTIKIPTSFLRVSKTDSSIPLTCHLELLRVDEKLATANTRYVPNSDFGQMMNEIRSGLSLAYGRKKTGNEFVLNVVSYERLISCLIDNLEDVQVDIEISD